MLQVMAIQEGQLSLNDMELGYPIQKHPRYSEMFWGYNSMFVHPLIPEIGTTATIYCDKVVPQSCPLVYKPQELVHYIDIYHKPEWSYKQTDKCIIYIYIHIMIYHGNSWYIYDIS